MSVDRKPASVAGTPVPAPISRLIQLRYTVSQPVFAAFLAGGAAGAVSRTVVSPLERLKILFQIQSVGREEYKMSVGKGLAKMWRDEGWRGFMRGNGTNCVRIVPYSAVQFGSYNFYKRVRLFDVLRRRFQINTMSGIGYQYKSIWDAIKVIVAQEGVKGLYKGIAPNLLKVAPSMASSWLSYEMTRDFFLSLRD
ncbi:MAG: hypothetical protein LQ348_002104 [Seirophora lacunosa]|nr:MAG: hypothetical protein LQ348_002104 [Seirophora lacunosa]